ncbi:MAG: hypothetical protein M1289_00840, partial [Patescibacteria group bacterium]|nr:hypothetical protein [Patescibacteria group bacterium]
SQEEDDIDLFIISSRGNLWFTRLILITMLILVGQYRGRGKKKSQKICLNMFLDEDGLMLPKERQDLYTAHEIAQVMPVFERNNTYIKFLDANKWVLKFLPNALDRVRNKELGVKNKKSDRLFIIYYLLFILEHMAKAIQLLSINQHKTIETISDDLLAFHPFDYRSYVLKEYNKRLKHYGL